MQKLTSQNAVIIFCAAGVIYWCGRLILIKLFRTGRAVKIPDGDGFTLKRKGLPDKRIRIAWIDAPEFTQPFGLQAREALRALVSTTKIRVRFVDKDRYSRHVAQVWSNRKDVGLEMLRQGLAWDYPGHSPGQSLLCRYRYAAAQRQAIRARKGLWADKRPQAPWDYRHRPWWKKWLKGSRPKFS